MKEKKITDKMLKRALKEKHEISSIGAIILFITLSIMLGITAYLLIALLFLIVKITPTDVQTNIIKIIANILEFKGFSIISSTIMSLIIVTIFIKIMNDKCILISKKQDLIHKFIIVTLVLTLITVLINLKNGQKKIHTEFSRLEFLEYVDCGNFENNRELYDDHHKDDENKFSDVNEIRDYYRQQYQSVVDTNLVENNTSVILENFILIIIMSVGIAYFYKEK